MILDYLGGCNVITRVLIKGRQERRDFDGFEDGGRGYEPRNAGSLQKVKEVREEILP